MTPSLPMIATTRLALTPTLVASQTTANAVVCFVLSRSLVAQANGI
jgi:hypothetical protein